MNKYLVSILIWGKSKKRYDITMVVEAENKDIAIQKVTEILRDDGFDVAGLDYCDLV